MVAASSKLYLYVMSNGRTRYYFNLRTPSGIVQDVEGSELPSLDEAREEAIKDARLLMSDAVRQGRDISGRSVEICNEAGDVLIVVAFREAISSREVPGA
jgi:hypothetical protein